MQCFSQKNYTNDIKINLQARWRKIENDIKSKIRTGNPSFNCLRIHKSIVIC